VSEREAELLKRLHRLEGVVQELSGQVELDGHKQHSPASDQSSSAHKDSSESVTDAGRNVRVVGMDEGTGTKKNWINRSFNLGDGPPKTAFKIEGVMGRLSIDEGKSQYVSNPFWASITDVCAYVHPLLKPKFLTVLHRRLRRSVNLWKKKNMNLRKTIRLDPRRLLRIHLIRAS